MDWIRSTFLYVRALVAPARYGLPPNLDKEHIEKKLEDLCRAELEALDKYSLIERRAKDQGDDDGGKMMIGATLYGRLMAQYCLNFRTVKLLRKIKGTEPLLEIFTLLTYCDEFAVFKCRNSDKRTLNELNRSSTRSTIRFPLRGRIQTTTAMASCLMQAVFGNLPIEDGSLQQEATKMINIGRRLIRCMVEFIYVGQGEREHRDGEGGGVYGALLSTLVLSQCLETRLWENSPYIAKQLKGIGAVYAGQLAARGKTSFQELVDSNPREVEIILKKNPPFGSDLIAFVRTLPMFSIELVLKQDYILEVTVVQKNDGYNKKLSVKISVLVGDSNNNVLFFKENLDANPGGSCRYQESLKLSDATVATVTGHVICSNWTGLDCSKVIVVNEEAAAAAASSSSSQKQRSRKVNNTNPSKKITEFYRKDDSKVNESRSEGRTSVEVDGMEKPDEDVEVITIEDHQDVSFLETFRFTQKPKLSVEKQNDDSLQFVTASNFRHNLSNPTDSNTNMIDESGSFDKTSSLEIPKCEPANALGESVDRSSHPRQQLRASKSSDSGYESYSTSHSANLSLTTFSEHVDFTSNGVNSSERNNFGFFKGSIAEYRRKPQNTVDSEQSINPPVSRTNDPNPTFKTIASLRESSVEIPHKRPKLDDSDHILPALPPTLRTSDESEPDSSPTNPKKLNFFSQPSTQSKILSGLATFLPTGPPRYNSSNRMQYFTEMHRRNPFILFGRPEDFNSQQRPRHESSIRRVCLFGVYSEMPRYRNEAAPSSAATAPPTTKTTTDIANERQVFRSINGADGDNSGAERVYQKNHRQARRGRRELDLGINEFLSSTFEELDPPKENFFK